MTYNSRLAQELGLWAEEQGRGHAFHMAAFQAYFSAGKNLADSTVLLEQARDCNLPVDEAEAVLASRSHRQQVDDDWQLARTLGITAVPTFILGNSRLVGAQSYQGLAALALQHSVARRN